MEEALKDERFKYILTDRRFRSIPKHVKKTAIDKRFHAMFKDKNFKGKGLVDKRGRPVNLTPFENLKDLYGVSESSENEEDINESSPKMKMKEKKIYKQHNKNIQKMPNKSSGEQEQSSDDVSEDYKNYTDVIPKQSNYASIKKNKSAKQNKLNNSQNNLSLLSNKELSAIIDDDSKESSEAEKNAISIINTHLKSNHSETNFLKKTKSPKENKLHVKQERNQLKHLTIKELSSILDNDSKESSPEETENSVRKKNNKKKSEHYRKNQSLKLCAEQEQSSEEEGSEKEEGNEVVDSKSRGKHFKHAAKNWNKRSHIVPVKQNESSSEDDESDKQSSAKESTVQPINKGSKRNTNIEKEHTIVFPKNVKSLKNAFKVSNKKSSKSDDSDEKSLEDNDSCEELTGQLIEQGAFKSKTNTKKVKDAGIISHKNIKSVKNGFKVTDEKSFKEDDSDEESFEDDDSNEELIQQFNEKGSSKSKSNSKKVKLAGIISPKNMKSVKRGLKVSDEKSPEDDDSNEESSEDNDSDEEPTEQLNKKGSSKEKSNIKKLKRVNAISPKGTESNKTGLNDSEESDSEDSDDSELDDNVRGHENIDHRWEELRNEAPDTDEITHRLAVCNMDWDRIRAEDLYVCFKSFKPVDGWINSVKIYPSEFGLKRMEEEKLRGPPELVEETLPLDDEEEEVEDKKTSRHHREKLRQYQINRLKYYYAVIDCDSPETANHLYEQLNGMEYESSSVRYDLRFVPDDMTFEHEPISTADNNTDLTDYKPRLFVNTALQQVKVNLTWDETDPKRREVLQRAFTDPDSVQDDIRAYLASTSGESESDEEDEVAAKEKREKKIEDRIATYRKLLQSIEEEEKEEKEKYEMEITWDPSLKEKTKEMVKEKMKKDTLNPFEEMLQKRKEKRKMKSKENKAMLKGAESHSGSDDSDADESITEDQNRGAKKLAELTLIADSKKEVDVEQKKTKKKKKKAKKEIAKVEEADNCKVDVNDPRFSAIYTSHLFNIDPSDPHFKKTDGNVALIKEKHRRLGSKDFHERNPKRAKYS